eukprot:COSAG06_NODE_5509_length_3436_cov_1.679353_1_plen_48_part_10
MSSYAWLLLLLPPPLLMLVADAMHQPGREQYQLSCTWEMQLRLIEWCI